MINLNAVYEALCTISDLTAEEAEANALIVENAVSFVQSLIKNPEDEGDKRIIFLAAAKANLDFSLSEGGDDGIVSFSAGDISLSKSASKAEKARLLFESAKNSCASLISDNDFCFRSV